MASIDVRLLNFERTGDYTANVTFGTVLDGKPGPVIAAVATMHNEDAPGRVPYSGAYLEVTGVAPVLAQPLALAVVRLARGEWDDVRSNRATRRLLRPFANRRHAT